MDIVLNNAILHVINNDGGTSYLSTQELDIDSDVCYEFINKHVKKLLDNPITKRAVFNSGSEVYEAVQGFKNGKIFFKEASARIYERLSSIMHANVDIPSADILIAYFEIKNDMYFAILKLNYKECFTHKIDGDENGSDNQIVKYRAVLPFDSGKVEEACLIPFDPTIVKIIEKPYPINGEPEFYFSKLFLDCDAEFSKKDKAKIINDAAEEINSKYFGDNPETIARFKAAVIEKAAEDEGIVDVANVAMNIFEAEEIKDEYISIIKDAGIRTEIDFGEKFSKQEFGSHKFKADNGIEIKFPAELADESSVIEFTNNADGTVSILLKNLRRSGK